MSLDENIYELRKQKLGQIEALGQPAYPNQFRFTHQIPEILAAYTASTGEALEADKPQVAVAGRLMAIRVMGKASFAHLQQQGEKLQIYIKKDAVGEKQWELFKLLDIGDHIGVRGYLFRTRTNELSVHLEEITFLSKDLLPLPEKFHGLTDVELRYRMRYVDLLDVEVRQVFVLSLIHISFGVLVAIAATLYQAQPQFAGFGFYNMVRVDHFSVFFHLVVLLVALATMLMSLDYLPFQKIDHGEYYALILLGSVGTCLMSSAVELVLIFIALEISSISSYILAGFRKQAAESAESSLKYFLLGSFATAFFLYGVDVYKRQAFSSPFGSKIFWAVGAVTAFMTSFYMFRLLFMTFFGEYRGAKDAGHDASHDAAHARDSHHGTPHESPWMMLSPLVLLAVLSIFGGLVGIGNRFEHFLDPVIQKVEEPHTSNLESVLAMAAEPKTEEHENKGLETALMGLSAVSYTHLDVYKRQAQGQRHGGDQA